jgi:hypothetical protein
LPSAALLLCGLSVTGALAWAGTARGANLLVLEIVDDDVREGLRARFDLLKAAGGVPGIVIAPLSKLKKIARAEHLDPSQLGGASAARQLGQTADIAIVLSGAVDLRNGRRVLHLAARDRNGDVVYRGNLDLAVGQLLPEEIDTATGELTAALQLEPAPQESRRRVVRQTQPPPATAPPSGVGFSPEGPAAAVPQPSEPQGPAQDRPDRFEDATLQVELGVLGSVASSSLDDDSKLEGCAMGGIGCLSALGSSPYPGVVARLQTFPFHRASDALAGLGLAVGGSFAELKVAGAAPGVILTARDIRIDGDAVYRLRLRLFRGDAAIYSPSLGLRAGAQTRDFDVPGSRLIPSLDRFGARVGAEFLEPVGHHMRMILGGVLSVSPTPGEGIEHALESRQTFSDGYEVSVEVQGRLGAPNASGFTGSLRVAYSEFNDCFERNSGQGCNYSGKQTSAGIDLMLGYALY